MAVFQRRDNKKGFTLVEVIVVAVIVAVLALVGIQLYQGYVVESRRNTAENLAASAAAFLQTAVNSLDTPEAAEAQCPTPLAANATWELNFAAGIPSTFTCPAGCQVTYDIATGKVSATVNSVPSQGDYRYKTVAAGP